MSDKLSVSLLSVKLDFREEDKAPPAEFRIFKSGANTSRKGSFKFSGDGAKECLERISEFGADYPVDYNHAMFRAHSAADPASEGRAAGWFKPEVRNGELWATEVQWTKEAADRLLSKEYKYISPAFNRNAKGEICELLNVALTNVPALNGLSPLMASQRELFETLPNEEKMLEKILTLLGLKSEATETEVESKIKSLTSGVESVLLATGTKTSIEAIETIELLSKSVSVLTAEADELKKKLAEADAEKKAVEVDAMLDSAKREGKITPAQAEAIRTKGIEDVGFLKVFLSSATKQTPGAVTEKAKGSMTASDEHRKIAKVMGIPVETLLKDVQDHESTHQEVK